MKKHSVFLLCILNLLLGIIIGKHINMCNKGVKVCTVDDAAGCDEDCAAQNEKINSENS